MFAVHCDMVALWDTAGIFLSPAEFERTMALAKGFCEQYEWLSTWASSKDRFYFHIVNKHHSLHLAKGAKFLNPKTHWCFLAEDYVGKISKNYPFSEHGTF